MISVVVPLFNEEKTVLTLHARILAALKTRREPFEIIFVDDGSTDNTAGAASALTPVRLIRMQRNYGQTAAIDVGIFHAKGDGVVLLDADLQNDPADIPRFLDTLNEGYDVVIGWRKVRNDHWTRVLFSKFANIIARRFLGLTIHDFGCGLKAYRSRFIKDFRLWGEAQVFLPAVAHQRGARITEIPVEHHARETGVAKVKISNMIRGGFDLISIVFFVRHFATPMRFFGGWGFFSLVLSSVAFGAAIVLKVMELRNISDTPLPIVGVLFAVLGVMLIMMGFLAEMLLRMHYSVTSSSPYFVREIKENT